MIRLGCVVILLAGVTVALGGLGSALLVLVAYGVALLVNRVMHLEPFHATALTLVSFIFVIWQIGRFLTTPATLYSNLLEDDDDEEK